MKKKHILSSGKIFKSQNFSYSYLAQQCSGSGVFVLVFHCLIKTRRSFHYLYYTGASSQMGVMGKRFEDSAPLVPQDIQWRGNTGFQG